MYILFINSDDRCDIFFYAQFNNNNSCKDSICNDPKLELGSYVKGLNNKICREWTERLGLSHRTVISHGVHGGCTKVN